MPLAIIDNEYFKKIITTLILVTLLILSFLVLKPILLSIIMGIILAIVISPVYDWFYKKLKIKWLSLTIICVLLILLIILPIWFLTPIFFKQSFEVFNAVQKVDFLKIIEQIFPSLSSDAFNTQFQSIFTSFISKSTIALMDGLTQWILNFPTTFLQLIIVFATFFFTLKDKNEIINYIKSLMPFSREVEQKLFQSSKNITISVVYGQIAIGIIQGLIVGVGLFIFGVPKTIFLTFITIIAGILPIVGTPIVWIPIAIFLLAAGNNTAGLGVLFFGTFSIIVEHLLRPILISRRSKMHPLLSLMGMIGGFFFFGIIGFVIGPLILAYVIIILEIYRGKETQGFFIKH